MYRYSIKLVKSS